MEEHWGRTLLPVALLLQIGKNSKKHFYYFFIAHSGKCDQIWRVFYKLEKF